VSYDILYQEIEGFFRALHVPGQDCITDGTDLNLAPDGKKAVFTATIFRDLGSAPVSRIGCVDLTSGKLSLIAAGAGSDRLPRFSPDGRWIAFLSDRDQPGNFQLFIADPTSDKTRACPQVDGVIESLAWSPDGTRLLLGVAGFGADMAGCQGGATTFKQTAVQASWMPTIDRGDASNLWRSAYVFDVIAQSHRRIGPEKLNVWECAWLGTQEITAIVTGSHSEGSWYQAKLVTLSLDGGAPQDVYQPENQIGYLAGSPDGKRVAFIEAVCSDRLIMCGDLKLIERRGGIVRMIDTHRVDVTFAAWRDENTLTYIGHRGLETVAGEASVDEGKAGELWSSVELTAGAWYPSFALHPHGGILIVAESYARPPEIAHVDVDAYRTIRSLATDESARADFNAGGVEPFTWKARDGLEIQGWLVKPPGKGPFPLVMDIHGGPVWHCRNRWQGRLRGAKVLADHGIASFYPNPRGSSGRGQDFARLVKGDMGGEDTHDYLTGIDALVIRGIADPRRLGVTGISYGGFMSAWLVTQDARFAAAVPISAVANWYSQHRTSQIPYFDALFLDGQPAAPNGLFYSRSPVMHAHRVRTPVLQLTGALDQNTPPTQALEFHRSLLEHGVVSVLATYPTAGHGIRGFPEVIDATTRYVGWFIDHFAAF